MAYTNIDDPSAYFQTVLWTGNTSAPRSITNDGNSNLQPDWVWGKNRTSAGTDHEVYDSNRGTGTSYNLKTSSTAVEGTSTTYGQLTSFDTDGFTVNAGGTNDDFWNENGSGFVAWQWKANGGTTSSLSGNLASVVQVNADAGFSIVTYTGSGGNGQSVNHGLGLTPEVIITKARNGTDDWYMYHKSIGTANFLKLNTADAQAGSSPYNAADPTSTAFFVSNDLIYVGELGANFVSYCFAPIQGYSKFGSYVGNGGTGGNNVFVYTGFKPAFIMIKNADATGHWAMQDNKRDGYNGQTQRVWADRTNSESGAALELVSNGFRITSTAGGYGASGNTYIYMAFAENPFTTSTGIPTTAR